MHELTGRISNISFSYTTGQPLITFEFEDRKKALTMVDELLNLDKLTVRVDKFRKKRSLDANRYFWKILGEMASRLRTDKHELYLKYIKEYGLYKDFVMTESEAKTFRKAWSMLGIGWPTEQVDYDQDGDRLVIRAYYGSSTYNTKQMSRLIDMVVEDAKSLGVETMTPAELERLKEGWHGSN